MKVNLWKESKLLQLELSAREFALVLIALRKFSFDLDDGKADRVEIDLDDDQRLRFVVRR